LQVCELVEQVAEVLGVVDGCGHGGVEMKRGGG
jgi:hypothetical protein